MQERRKERVLDLYHRLAAEFIQKEANSSSSLITVTRVHISDDGKILEIFFTTLPEEKENDALDFISRKRGDFRDYIKSHAKLRALPSIRFEIDYGERNRQNIDSLLNGQ